MINKKISLAIISVLTVGLASASTFGTLQYQQSKATDGGPIEYRIGMINLGENALNVEFEASDTQKINLNIEDQITLEPSQVSDSPRGRGWYNLGNGSYAKMKDYSFDVAARNIKNTSFTITVTAATNESENAAAAKKIIQERQYEFSIVNSSYERGLVNFQEDGKQDRSIEQNPSQNVSIDENGSKNNEASRVEESSQGGLKTSTKLLFAGALISTTYLVKVMMF